MLSISIIIANIDKSCKFRIIILMAKKLEAHKTISEVMDKYVDTVKQSRSIHTAQAYKNALKIFSEVLETKNMDPYTTPVEKLTEDVISPLAMYLKTFSPA